MTQLSLRDLGLQPGQAKQQELELELRPYRQGGFGYSTADGHVAARIDVTAMQSGLSLRLRMRPELHGPCSRCLEEAVMPLDVDTYEIHDVASGDSELISEFVTDDELDVTDWAQNAIGVEFPVRVLCGEDCKGLCPTCGVNRNETNCDCAPVIVDSRWDKLKELKLDDG